MSGDLDKTRTIIATHSERPSGPAKPCLVIIAGTDMGRRIDLTNETVEIGRSEEATITVNSDLVSRRHASIQQLLGRYVVADLQSTNGTFVNDERITSHRLRDGDRIRVGRTIIKYMETHVEVEYHKQLLDMVSVDALTGAHNKRFFDEAFPREVVRHAATREPLCVVAFDIDHFKQINDRYGHPAGDAVLKAVVEVVRKELRGRDVVCRVGGEEFAVILPDTVLADGLAVAERLRRAIEGRTVSTDPGDIQVTASLGVAGFDGSGETAAALYQRADQRLYEAKRGGRNRVC